MRAGHGWCIAAEIHLLISGEVAADVESHDAGRILILAISVVFQIKYCSRDARAFVDRKGRNRQICRPGGLARFKSASRSCRHGRSVGDQSHG